MHTYLYMCYINMFPHKFIYLFIYVCICKLLCRQPDKGGRIVNFNKISSISYYTVNKYHVKNSFEFQKYVLTINKTTTSYFTSSSVQLLLTIIPPNETIYYYSIQSLKSDRFPSYISN